MRRSIRALVIGDGPSRFIPVYGSIPGSTDGSLNRFINGDFEGSEIIFTQWYWDQDEIISFDTQSPISGRKSLKVVTQAQDPEEGIVVQNQYLPTYVAQEVVKFSIALKGTGTVTVTLRVPTIVDSSPVAKDLTWDITLTDEVQIISRHIPLPDGISSGQSTLKILTNGEEAQAATFWVDELYFGTPS